MAEPSRAGFERRTSADSRRARTNVTVEDHPCSRPGCVAVQGPAPPRRVSWHPERRHIRHSGCGRGGAGSRGNGRRRCWRRGTSGWPGCTGWSAALERFAAAQIDVLIVAAGMDGALPSVVAGLVDVPVIGLPTSIGYGLGAGGIGALTTMLQSCAPGLVVVNIDNGIGAGATAALIANRAAAAAWSLAPRRSGFTAPRGLSSRRATREMRQPVGRAAGTGLRRRSSSARNPPQHFRAGASSSPHDSLAAPGKPGIVVVDCGEELGNAGPSDGIRRADRHGTAVIGCASANAAGGAVSRRPRPVGPPC